MQVNQTVADNFLLNSISTRKMLIEENIQFLFKFSIFFNKQKKFTESNNS